MAKLCLSCAELIKVVSQRFVEAGVAFNVTPEKVVKEVFKAFKNEKLKYVKVYFKEKHGRTPRVMVVPKYGCPPEVFLLLAGADIWIKEDYGYSMTLKEKADCVGSVYF